MKKNYDDKNWGYYTFSYSSPTFRWMERRLREEGKYTVNLGDYIQSYCIKQLFNSCSINPIRVDRDSFYHGDNVNLITNAIIFSTSLPIKPIIPVFLGVSFVDNPLIPYQFDKYLKTYEPIGCRDIYSYNLCKKQNIDAFVSGCYSLTLPRRKVNPKHEKVFFVGIPESFKKYIPQKYLQNAVFIDQREVFYHYPLTEKDMYFLENKAEKLVERYKNEATLVVSPLLHCISPCIAMGIPVILIRNEYNERFSAIQQITKMYTEKDWDKIDWCPKSINIESLKEKMILLFKYILNGQSSFRIQKELNKYYNLEI